MHDPFAVLELFDELPTAHDIARAFANRAPIVGHATARGAMDLLRNHDERAAATLLAPSMTDAARAARARLQVQQEHAASIDLALRILAVALDQLDHRSRTSVAIPRPRRDPRHYLYFDPSVFDV